MPPLLLRDKRNNYACVRCRKRHTRCPPGNPCEKCVKAGVPCEYTEVDRKVIISVRYLEKLHAEISELKKQNAILRGKSTTESSATFKPATLTKTKKEPLITGTASMNSMEVVPPFTDRQRRLVLSKTGEKFYVGLLSMTLFGLEVESMLPDNAIRTRNGELNPDKTLPTVLEREGNAYKISLGKTETRPGILVKFVLPSYSYALLLIDTFITYNDGCFYFFNEGLVKESLRQTYSATATPSASASDSVVRTVNFCKFLLIFAIGEMYLGTANDTNGTKLSTPRLPGSSFFQQALELFTGLFAAGAVDNVAREGGVEVMLLYAFYLQVADCTVALYFYFGVALRALLILGMHVDVEKSTLSRAELEHRRRLWWTVYMFERMLLLKAGLPLSLSDDLILTELPQDITSDDKRYIFPEAEYIRNCVTIVQINALILSSLYQKEPTQNILPVIADLIGQLFRWRENLPEFLRPDFHAPDLKILRLVTNLMTEYFQGVNLAVRPLLFYLTTKKIKQYKTTDQYVELSQYLEPILTLLNALFQGLINTIRLLWALMPQNMVALFGYMDREYLFTLAATLILFNLAFGVHDATRELLDHALCIFTKMRNLGNNPAELRLEQLMRLLQTINVNDRMSDLIEKYSHGGESEVTLEPQPTFNKKLLNKQRRIKVNNNRFVYQREAAGDALDSLFAGDEVGLEFFSNMDINNVDNDIWDEITSQQTWLNDVSEEFQGLIDSLNK